MSADCFVDTTVLLYAISSSPGEQPKAERARRILGHESFGLSAQVLQEFFVNATQKIATPISDAQALELIDLLVPTEIVAIDLDLVLAAVACKQKYRLSYWDGAIVAAAQSVDAAVLYSEDLAHGADYDGVRVVNPFLGTP